MLRSSVFATLFPGLALGRGTKEKLRSAKMLNNSNAFQSIND